MLWPLKNSAVRSGFFSLGNQVAYVVINFGSLAILGRLLTPEDFGLMGIILAAFALFLPLLDMGLTPAFIKLAEVDEDASNAFFTLNLYLGIFITICLGITAPILAFIYNRAVLLPLMLVFAISVVIKSLSQQPLAVLTRERRFDKIMIVNLTALIVDTCTVIIGAFFGLGVWALILRSLVNAGTGCLMAHRLARQDYKIVGIKTIGQYKQSFRFGGEIVISRLVGGMLLSLDKLIFGKFFSVETLGAYTRAFQLAIMPDSNIRTSLSSPALSHLARVDGDRHRAAYLIMCNVILFVAGLPCLVFIVIGDWILPWFMGYQWSEAGIYLQVLGIWGLGRLFQGLSVIIHLNETSIRNLIKFNVISLLILIAPLVAAYKGFGPFEFILALSVGNIVYWLFVIMKTLYVFTDSVKIPWQFFWSFFLTLIGALCLGFIVKYKILHWTDPIAMGISFKIFLVTLLMVVGVILAQSVLNRYQVSEIYNFVIKKG